jgi:SAM-dependent methyltransferase
VARVAGFRLTVRPTVFHPRYFLTSEFFANFLSDIDLTGKRVADVGTGSGILALAAARAGAASVVALDINPNAAKVAAENAHANGPVVELSDKPRAIPRNASGPSGHELRRPNDIYGSNCAGKLFPLETSAYPSSCRVYECFIQMPPQSALARIAFPRSERLMPHLEHVPRHREQILVDADSPLDHIFFPDSGVVSVMAVYSDIVSPSPISRSAQRPPSWTASRCRSG